MLIRNARLHGRTVDVRLGEGRVVEIAPGLRGEELLDAAGANLLPGLVDHHLHLHALAAAAVSVSLAGLDAPAAATVLAAASADAAGWVRAVGCDRDLSGADLERLHPHRPVRVQHRSGALWTVNVAGARQLGLETASHPGVERGGDGLPTGRLWRADSWLRTRLPPGRPPDLGAVGARLAGLGITAVTDATPDLDGFDASALPQRVMLLGVPLERAAPAGTVAGPFKIVLSDHDLPGLDDLADRIGSAHRTGRGVAVHCVSREALVLLLAAIDGAGAHPADRIEHAALVPAELVAELAARRLRVVTQPGFLADRGDDYLRDVASADLPDLYRCATLHAAGIPLALSSDAPHGPLDPWTVIDAAVERRTRAGADIGPAERITRQAALDAYLAAPDDPGGPPRPVMIGAPADLIVRDASDRILATVIAGVRVA